MLSLGGSHFDGLPILLRGPLSSVSNFGAIADESRRRMPTLSGNTCATGSPITVWLDFGTKNGPRSFCEKSDWKPATNCCNRAGSLDFHSNQESWQVARRSISGLSAACAGMIAASKRARMPALAEMFIRSPDNETGVVNPIRYARLGVSKIRRRAPGRSRMRARRRRVRISARDAARQAAASCARSLPAERCQTVSIAC